MRVGRLAKGDQSQTDPKRPEPIEQASPLIVIVVVIVADR
jgi:hypothetical protein